MSKKMLQAAAGNAGESLYVEDVFSTYLYEGNSSTQTITNGIDLDGEGGLVWLKSRSSGASYYDHVFCDTERGPTKYLACSGILATSGEQTQTASPRDITSFNSNGFSLGIDNTFYKNVSGETFASWTFRKAEKFFDVVTYTGTGSNQAISHNLGSVPGCIIVRALSGDNWYVWHNSLSTSGAGSSTGHKRLILNSTAVEESRNGINTVTSTSFTVLGSDGETGGNGTSYVAYVFAHTPTSNFVEESFSASYFADGTSPVSVNGPDGSGEYNMYTNTSIGNTYAKIAGVNYQVSGTNNWDGISDVIFAATGSRYKQGAYEYTNGGVAPHYQVDYYSQYGGPVYEDEESFIVCGSYTGNATSGHFIDIGFEPQWVLIKNANATKPWYLVDNMRNMGNNGATNLASNYLFPNESWSEDYIRTNYASLHHIEAKPTGFAINPTDNDLNGSGKDYIYIAIRRPMKTPESGTEVFAIDTPDSTSPPKYRSAFPVDMAWFKSNINSSVATEIANRLTGTKYLTTTSTAAEANQNGYKWDFQNGWFNDQGTETNNRSWMFKRATGFFDVVAYTGDGSATHNINHNLTVLPEIMIVKRRDSSSNGDWYVYHKDKGYDKYSFLNDGSVGFFGSTTVYNAEPTSTVFTVGSNAGVNASGSTYIWYGFATTAGVSKVGSYTGTGSNVDVDCGFSAGARFILIKRSNDGVGGAGNWFYWDHDRGIIAGNDPYLLLNSTVAQVTNTDYIDPLSSGFTVTAGASFDGLNNSGGSYIFLAIA